MQRFLFIIPIEEFGLLNQINSLKIWISCSFSTDPEGSLSYPIGFNIFIIFSGGQWFLACNEALALGSKHEVQEHLELKREVQEHKSADPIQVFLVLLQFLPLVPPFVWPPRVWPVWWSNDMLGLLSLRMSFGHQIAPIWPGLHCRFGLVAVCLY